MTIEGDALSLADLENFHPEDDMILANTTSIGMQPKVDETPIVKVCLVLFSLQMMEFSLNEKVMKLMLSYIQNINPQ